MRVFVAGHSGLVGSAITQKLRQRGDDVITRTHAELDLTNQLAVRQFMRSARPDAIIAAAGRNGGIGDRTAHPSAYLYENMMIASNLIHQAHDADVQRLVYIGASEVYPKTAPQPIRESMLMSGKPDVTSEPLAIAKIAGIALCNSYRMEHERDYRCVTPTNVYGPGDDFDPRTAHVVPGLIRRCHEAVRRGDDTLAVWGTGKPLRDFIYIDDMASAVLHVLDLSPKIYAREVDPTLGHLNIGSGSDITIRDLSKAVARVAGFSGRLILDTAKPDGPSRRLLDTRRMDGLGWQASVPLKEGLQRTYDWFVQTFADA